MEYKDALEYLKILRNLVDITEHDSGAELQRQTYDIAIEAVEKQTQKKPMFKTAEQSNKEYYFKKEYYICPSCGKALVIQNHREDKTKNELNRWQSGLARKHCDDCGQAINWEGAEDNE